MKFQPLVLVVGRPDFYQKVKEFFDKPCHELHGHLDTTCSICSVVGKVRITCVETGRIAVEALSGIIPDLIVVDGAEVFDREDYKIRGIERILEIMNFVRGESPFSTMAVAVDKMTELRRLEKDGILFFPRNATLKEVRLIIGGNLKEMKEARDANERDYPKETRDDFTPPEARIMPRH